MTNKDPRPRTSTGQITTTPSSATLVDLLGGYQASSVTLTNDEMRHLRKFYGFVDDKTQNPLIQAGNNRNVIRHAEIDGLRLIAYLSQYLEPGDDPVEVLSCRLSECGYDVGEQWESGEEEKEE